MTTTRGRFYRTELWKLVANLLRVSICCQNKNKSGHMQSPLCQEGTTWYAGIYFHTGLQNRKHWYKCSQCTQTLKICEPQTLQGGTVQAPQLQSLSRNLVHISFRSQIQTELSVVRCKQPQPSCTLTLALQMPKAIKMLLLEYKNIKAFTEAVQNSLKCSGLQWCMKCWQGEHKIKQGKDLTSRVC